MASDLDLFSPALTFLNLVTLPRNNVFRLVISYYIKRNRTHKHRSPRPGIQPRTFCLPGRRANHYSTEDVPTSCVQIALITLLVTDVIGGPPDS